MSTHHGFSGADMPSELIVVGIKACLHEDGTEHRDVEKVIAACESYDVSAVLATLRDGADAAGDYLAGSATSEKLARFSALMTQAMKELA